MPVPSVRGRYLPDTVSARYSRHGLPRSAVDTTMCRLSGSHENCGVPESSATFQGCAARDFPDPADTATTKLARPGDCLSIEGFHISSSCRPSGENDSAGTFAKPVGRTAPARSARARRSRSTRPYAPGSLLVAAQACDSGSVRSDRKDVRRPRRKREQRLRLAADGGHGPRPADSEVGYGPRLVLSTTCPAGVHTFGKPSANRRVSGCGEAPSK